MEINYRASVDPKTYKGKKWLYNFPELSGQENIIRIVKRPFVRISSAGSEKKLNELHKILRNNGFKRNHQYAFS